MAICTLQGHVSRAINFYEKTENMYFSIGKTSPWTQADLGGNFDSKRDYEQNPPTPKNTDNVIEVAGFKKVESAFLVMQDPTGELEYRNTKWKIVSKEDAVAKGARWVYISAYVSYNELPTDIVYRQLGVFSGLQKKDGISSGKFALLPKDVENAGILEIIDNRKPVYRDLDIREKLKLIIEF